MTTEDRNDILKFYNDAVYEHLKHSELFDAVKRNSEIDQLAERVANELFEAVQKQIDIRVDALEVA